MSDTSTQPPGDDPEGGDPNLRQLREKAKRADEAEAALAAARRENAMLKSGVDLETPQGDFFTRSYQGDLDDIEALKAEAQRLGVPFRG